jgi:DNA modification methylase
MNKPCATSAGMLSPPTASGIPIHCAFDEVVDVATLVPNPRNPNRHPESQVDLLAQIIKEQGWRAPITVSNRSGFIVRGHARLLAALNAGWQQVPVDRQDYPSEAAEWADLVADNRLAELAESDEVALLRILRECESESVLALTGYDDESLAALIAQVNESHPRVEEFDPEAALEDPTAAGIAVKVQPGQLWELGRHRLLCGDCTVLENWDRLMAGDVAHAVVTDPPYAVSYCGGRAAQQERIAKARRGIDQPSDAYWDDLTPQAYRSLLNQSLALAHQHSDAKAPLYLWFASAHIREVLECMAETSWQERNLIVWVKNNGAGALFAQYKHWYEPCFYAHKTGEAPRWHGGTGERTVWEHDKPLRNEGHPTVKPLPLIEHAIANATKPRQLVVDPFLGSGTAIIAAERTGRICYGMDLEPRYADVIIARWEAETGETAALAERVEA